MNIEQSINEMAAILKNCLLLLTFIVAAVDGLRETINKINSKG